MKKTIITFVLAITVLLTWGATSVIYAQSRCTTIQDGTLLTSVGDVIDSRYDSWGYNYQAHVFNGKYCDSYRDAAWCQPYKDVDLQMKWNDAWMSNKDCDDDDSLDRHYGYDSYIGSGAWLTNHQKGTYQYVSSNGKLKTAHWFYFVKIVAVPDDAYLEGDVWHDAEGVEIGPSIWGSFAIIESVYNDPVYGATGLEYHSPLNSGLGSYGP